LLNVFESAWAWLGLMDMRTIIYYVSGHGFGHATRASEVMRAIAKREPETRIVVRTSAPAHLFSRVPGIIVQSTPHSLDPGVIEEADALGVDVPATIAQIEGYYAARETNITHEVAVVRREVASLVVADFPPLAGNVAAAAGVPCLGIGNFTWNWIYDPFLSGRGQKHLLAWIREGYAKLGTYLRLPFSPGEGLEMFRRVVPVPLVARRAELEPGEIVSRLRLDPADVRPRVLLAMRGRIPPRARAKVAADNRDMFFMHFGRPADDEHDNCRSVSLGHELSFGDVLSVCDVAVSKLGYGILSECVAAQKALLAPPRRHFREDEVFEREAGRYVRLQPIAAEEFAAGDWSAQLRKLLTLPPPVATMPTDGADACARFIAEFGR
jgi:L-arabinokinase